MTSFQSDETLIDAFWSVLGLICFFVSAMSTASIIFNSFKKRSPDEWTCKFTSTIAISNVIQSSGFCIAALNQNYNVNPSNFNWICSIQGFLITFGGTSSFLLILCICVLLYTRIFYPNKWVSKKGIPRDLHYLSAALTCFIYIISFILAFIPFVRGSYTLAENVHWCWIGRS